MGKSLSGVHAPHRKNTAAYIAEKLPVPSRVAIPMSMHMGAPCNPVVAVGDEVKLGQLIGDTDAFMSSPIYASVSGKVVEIADHMMPNGSKCKSVVIESDGLQTIHEDIKPFTVNGKDDLINAARACGLVGLGGAGFPTHIKLNPKNLSEIDTLVLNGAECEPYITSDTRLMIDRGQDLINGIKLVLDNLKIPRAVIGIEKNKPEAIKNLKSIIADDSRISVCVLNAVYPKGAEKVIIYETTGKVVEEGKLPSDCGAIVLNVSTVAKLYDFVSTGMPLVEKTITIDGSAIKNPKNVTVPLGTSIETVIEFCGGYVDTPRAIFYGGPMMGLALFTDTAPVIKNTNAIVAFLEKDLKHEPETACIRCGSCRRACPLTLSPAEYDRAYHAGNVDMLKKLKVNLCMECGCCSYVCPAKRNLVTYNRLGKAMLRKSV